MADRSLPTVGRPEDIRGLTAEFPAQGAHFAVIRGNDGFITAAAGAKVGIFSRWNIRYVNHRNDKAVFRFKAQFSWVNEPLMAMVGNATLKGRVILQMMTTKGRENVDILGWDEWRYEDGVLTLENIYQTEGVKFRPMDK